MKQKNKKYERALALMKRVREIQVNLNKDLAELKKEYPTLDFTIQLHNKEHTVAVRVGIRDELVAEIPKARNELFGYD